MWMLSSDSSQFATSFTADCDIAGQWIVTVTQADSVLVADTRESGGTSSIRAAADIARPCSLAKINWKTIAFWALLWWLVYSAPTEGILTDMFGLNASTNPGGQTRSD